MASVPEVVKSIFARHHPDRRIVRYVDLLTDLRDAGARIQDDRGNFWTFCRRPCSNSARGVEASEVCGIFAKERGPRYIKSFVDLELKPFDGGVRVRDNEGRVWTVFKNPREVKEGLCGAVEKSGP